MEISASEAEDRGFSGSGLVNLDRVTKEQIYAAYRRTQERYTKYRTQYADLARHYKLLERENAKARVLIYSIILFYFYSIICVLKTVRYWFYLPTDPRIAGPIPQRANICIKNMNFFNCVIFLRCILLFSPQNDHV